MDRNQSFFSFSILSVAIAAAESRWNILAHRTKNVRDISLRNYCESWRMNVELHNIREFETVPQECIGYVGKYITSTRYKVDSEKAVEEALVYLSTSCNLKKDGRDAWIFDIDDTLLSTVPYHKKRNFGGTYDELGGVQNYKGTVRKQLIADGYTIWGIVGDQYSSINGLPTAKRTFKLPNPMYYTF